ncbi:hypothetical protein B0H17DRAFT_163965 [Mycena rosella]|uniref:Uncharacterized protein n=1 Tax=Mycena rosella TaxID=1033263 RepID=A0AAD7DWX3_MYCRO|nr:hypothetical protein B0H17DRAFT_163965 [Mycena rosella]
MGGTTEGERFQNTACLVGVSAGSRTLERTTRNERRVKERGAFPASGFDTYETRTRGCRWASGALSAWCGGQRRGEDDGTGGRRREDLSKANQYQGGRKEGRELTTVTPKSNSNPRTAQPTPPASKRVHPRARVSLSRVDHVPRRARRPGVPSLPHILVFAPWSSLERSRWWWWGVWYSSSSSSPAGRASTGEGCQGDGASKEPDPRLSIPARHIHPACSWCPPRRLRLGSWLRTARGAAAGRRVDA